MSKQLFVLGVAVLVSALATVELRHRNRLDFVALQTLTLERDALNVERGQLLLEEGTWAQHRRVEGLARSRLGMALPAPEQIVVVRPRGAGR